MAENAADTTRWQGFTHKELHRLLNEGTGPAASADPSRRWAEIAGTLTEVGQDLRHAIDKSGAAWSGRAAGAAYDSLNGLVTWAQQTASGAAQMRQSVESQAEFLAKARADMPVPEDAAPAAPDPTGGAAQQVLAAQQDKEPVEASSSTGAQRAFEVMTTYQRSTSTNTGGMAPFPAPGEVVGGTGVEHHSHSGIVLNTPVGSIGIGVPSQPEPERDDHHDHHDEGHHHHHHDWDSTTGASFDGDVIRPRPAPGSFTVAAPRGEWFPLATIGWGGEDYLSSGRVGGGGGRTSVPTGGMPTTSGGPTSGSPGMPGSSSGVPGSGGSTSGPGIGSAPGSGPHAADLSAAGPAAAAAGTPAAATPGAAAGPGTSGAGSNPTDPRALRRLGVDSTIGSGQWFGDTPDYEVRGASPNRRRRDLTAPQKITESVSVDGEEHQLPHNVIGES